MSYYETCQLDLAFPKLEHMAYIAQGLIAAHAFGTEEETVTFAF